MKRIKIGRLEILFIIRPKRPDLLTKILEGALHTKEGVYMQNHKLHINSIIFFICSLISFALAFLVRDILWLSLLVFSYGIYPCLFLAIVTLQFEKYNKNDFNNKKSKKDKNNFTAILEAFLICLL